ncbi:MAG: RNA polymerase sigma factor [Bacteroidota bacterium]
MNLHDKNEVGVLVSSCLKGDRNSQQKFFKCFYGKMLAVCMRYANDYDDAKDIVQEGFIKVFANLKGFENQGSLEGWVRRIVVNTAIDCVRKKHFNNTVDIEDSPEAQKSSATHEQEKEDEAYTQLKAEVVMKLIQKLSPMYKAVFNLYVIENYSHKEISEELGISVGTSKSNLAKAKMNLKKLFDNYVNEHREV